MGRRWRSLKDDNEEEYERFQEMNITGQNNSAFGNSAMRNNTTGQFNSAFGHSAMYSNTGGSNNNAFGYGALFISSHNNILKISKNEWEKIYLTMQSEKPSAGYGLEKMWSYLLNTYL